VILNYSLNHNPRELDVLLVIGRHPLFERRGDDLYTNLTIALVDALTGFTMQIDHLDGHKVVVERSKVTWPGARIAKKNEGMPNYENNNVRGTLFITFDVNFPKGELSQDDKAGQSGWFSHDFMKILNMQFLRASNSWEVSILLCINSWTVVIISDSISAVIHLTAIAGVTRILRQVVEIIGRK